MAYGLALAGEAGAREVIANMMAELELTMALAGCPNVAAITRDSVVWLDVTTGATFDVRET